MNDEQRKLAEAYLEWSNRIVSGGMSVSYIDEWNEIDSVRVAYSDKAVDDLIDEAANDPLPDLTDPATKGAILGRLRAVRNDPYVSCIRVGAGWAVWAFPLGDAFKSTRIALEDTEEAALVAACLATRVEELT